jgi:hypothetical protein
MDGHWHEDVAACAGPSPAFRDGLAEYDREPALAAVLQLMERGPDQPFEWRAPLELDERRRYVGGQPKERATRSGEAGEKARPAWLADGRALDATAGAVSREGKIEHPVPETAGAVEHALSAQLALIGHDPSLSGHAHRPVMVD